MTAVIRRHPRVSAAILYGSRAQGTHTARSDVDLALVGAVSPLEAEALAADLDELPLPYRFDVRALDHIDHPGLRARIERVGIVIHQNAEGSVVPLSPRAGA